MIGRRLLGIDFGTSEVKIYKNGSGIVLREKNVVAMKGKKEIVAAGNDAFDMLGKEPEKIDVSMPIKNGVIADIGKMQTLLDGFLKEIFGGRIKNSDYIVAVPKDITEVEKRAFYEVLQKSSAKIHSLYAVDKPLATALGMDIDIAEARGVLTVDIGADTTEIAVISLEGVVVSKLLPIGGFKLDSLIQMAVKRKHNLLIGEKCSERLKISLASATQSEPEKLRVYGRDVVSGLPGHATVDAELIYNAIKEQISQILGAIRQILERTPPEISAEILETGIYVSGGSAHIQNLEKRIREDTNLKVNIVEDAENVVAKGLGKIIENRKLLRLTKSVR